MNPDDRLKEILVSSAVDPGPKQDWDGFIEAAHRDRFVHRAMFAAAAVFVGVLVFFGTMGLDTFFDRSAPAPAEEDKRQERRLEEEVDEVEERVRETKEIAEDARIVPGPGKVPSDDGGGDEPIVGDDDGAPPVDEDTNEGEGRREVAPGQATCRGEKATIVGTPGDDTLEGTAGPDMIAGLGGNDEIRGGGGLDYLCGGDGIDDLFGDAARDSLVGGPGDDHLDGGDGFDFVHFPTAPRDMNINLEQGFIQGDGYDQVVGVEAAEGTDYGDNFVGTDEANYFYGGAGSDAINGLGGADFFSPGPGDDGMAGHGGLDTVSFSSSNGRSGVEVDLERNIATGEGLDRLNSIENVNGTFANDVISGNDKANSFFGSFGDDTLSGGGNEDVLVGADGDDTLDGGIGTDGLDGGPGDDTCTNGETRDNCERTGPVGALLLLGLLARCVFGRKR